jgi:nucleotide-binding universal stress UspA family protein
MNKILVGLDASPRESIVLRAAREMAEKLGAKLLLLRAITLPVELPPAALSDTPDHLRGLLEEDARDHLRELAESLPSSLVAGTRVVLDSPWHALCETAREEKADLVVIGSHGYTGIDRLIGTTAAKVVNHADGSVLVVRTAPQGGK